MASAWLGALAAAHAAGCSAGATPHGPHDAAAVDAPDDTAVDAPPDATVADADGDAATGSDVIDAAQPADAADGAPAGSFARNTYVGAAGSRDYWLFDPGAGDGTARPLVVVLHGCTMSAPQMAASTRYNELAALQGFFVAYPEQTSLANPILCWNWELPADEVRGGEPAIIAGITAEVLAHHRVDPRRVYAIGISAGGAMSVVLAATYPDVFTAVGSVAGCAFTDLACQNLGLPAPVMALGTTAYNAMGANARVVPFFVEQGSADTVVAPTNADRVVHQWLWADDLADNGAADGTIAQAVAASTTGAVPGGHAYGVEHYVDAHGAPLLERWTITGMGHAWSGGAAGAAYTDPAGPDITAASYQFFAAHSR